MYKSSFIRKWIKEINEPKLKDRFSALDQENNPFNSVQDLDEYLKDKLHKTYPATKNKIFKDWERQKFVKAKIKDLANEYGFKHSHLKDYLLKYVGDTMCDRLKKGEMDELIKGFIDKINKKFKKYGFKTISKDVSKVFKNSLHFNLQRGFPVNLANLNSGIMTANAGDSHQFLFLARAILAGFNCSNVDVRSSKYDAIIDYNQKLYRIQIKGITSSTSKIELKDRDRGGQGIDHTHERNKGKKITSEDCDIYVAVDKNSGICYLIPMKWIDIQNLDSIKMNDIQDYRERWNIFETM